MLATLEAAASQPPRAQADLAEVLKLSELKGYWADIAARRHSLLEQHQGLQVQLDSIGQTVEHVEALLDSCERVRQKLRTFAAAERRLAFEALNVRVHGCRTNPWRLRGRFYAVIAREINALVIEEVNHENHGCERDHV